MLSITLTRRARVDLLEIWSYIAEDNPRAADRTIREIRGKVELLAEFPNIGRSREDLGVSVRSFVVGAHIIYYQVIERTLRVLHVLHGARDLDTIIMGAGDAAEGDSE